MQELNIDTGVREYRINGGGVLRFNPSDPNVYSRFLQAADRIAAIEQEMAEEGRAAQATGQKALELLAKADRKTKEVLTWVFGEENDFDRLLGGVNLMAVAANGERVVTNLFAALQPQVQAGAEAFLSARAAHLAAAADAREAARREAAR